MLVCTDHFDNIAEEYDRSLPSHVARHYLEKRVRFIRKLLPSGLILDIGCGTGVLARRLSQEGYHVAGLDSSLGMLKVMVKTTNDGMSVHGNALHLPFRSESFDLVVCVAVLHHIADAEEVADTISEMVRVAKVGGKVLIWDHNPLNPYWPVIMRRVSQDIGGERLIPLNDILRGLQRTGQALDTQVWRLGWMPDFAPKILLPLLKLAEVFLEKVPLVREMSAHNVVTASKVGGVQGVGR